MISYFWYIVFVYIFMLSNKVTGDSSTTSPSYHMPLCDVDGITQEISRAIEILKIKAQKQATIGNINNQLRQDDDDDGDIPYYVPAIAKVVASVLSQNATNVIEESFGFIPPEVNKNIRYVLGLVAETVAKLRPTPAPTDAPTTLPPASTPAVAAASVPLGSVPSSGADIGNPAVPAVVPVVTPSVQQSANLEDILAYALAQQLISVERTPSTENILRARETNAPFIPAIKATTTNAPELFTSTFKYSEGLSVTSGSLSIGDELSVYAPNYAPNYGFTSTPSPIYASAFGHNAYTPPPVSNIIKTTSPISVLNATTVIVEEKETTESSEGTTEDYYDENVTEEAVVVGSSTKKTITYAKGTGSSTSATVIAVTEEEDEYDTKVRSILIN